METSSIRRLDFFTLIITYLIVAFGVMARISATDTVQTPLESVLKDGVYIFLGTVLLLGISLIDYRKLINMESLLYVVMIMSLLIVLSPLGATLNGSSSWIKLGSFTFQPSEVAKVLYILTFGAFLTKRHEYLNNVSGTLVTFLYAGPPLLLILLQPDLGTSLVIIVITFGMLLASGAHKVTVAALLLGGLGFFVLWIALHLNFGVPIFLQEYQITRFTIFLDPYNDGMNGLNAGRNIIQSLIAVGSGGLQGKGYMQGVQKNRVSVHESDFIISTIGEELGFVGILLLLLLFFVFLFRALMIAHECSDQYGFLIIIGIVCMFAFHILENVGMGIGMMPITGIPLPFISAGGSNMLACLGATGVILSVSMRRNQGVF